MNEGLTLATSASLTTVSERESARIIFIFEAAIYPYTATSSIVYNNPKYDSVFLGFAVTRGDMRTRFFRLISDRQGLTAFLEDVQTRVCNVVVSYISIVLVFLSERSDEDGVVLRGDEGNSVEINERGHRHW